MVTSDFRLEVEIQPFHANTMKNMPYAIHSLFMAELPKYLHVKANRFEEHDDYVRFLTGSGNTAVSHMHDEGYAI